MPYIIRTSDRINFKRCRRAWDLGSKIRQNFEANRLPKPLEFGTAIHAALEDYYKPEFFDKGEDLRQALAITQFASTLDGQIKTYLRHTQRESLSEEDALDYSERLGLGRGMLTNYFGWAQKEDRNWKPKFVEIEFEVPIIVPENMLPHLPLKFGIKELDNGQYQLYYGEEPVVYQGRLDALMEDAYGKYWIWDHKTTAALGDTSHLELDEQCGSYCWAIQTMLGVRVEGVVYNELFKGVPHKPKVLKKGTLSVDKSQNTTYELYLEAIQEVGQDPAQYEDMLDFLKEQGNKFFRRVQVHRNQEELRNLQDRICLEAIDMLNSPNVYPNPTRINCSGCMYRTPCLALNDGSDLGWILKENYHSRTEAEETKKEKELVRD